MSPLEHGKRSVNFFKECVYVYAHVCIVCMCVGICVHVDMFAYNEWKRARILTSTSRVIKVHLNFYWPCQQGDIGI